MITSNRTIFYHYCFNFGFTNSFTNNTTGTVMVQVSDVKGIYPSSYYMVDTGANTAERVPTTTFAAPLFTRFHSSYRSPERKEE